jgi:hypothetical protein
MKWSEVEKRELDARELNAKITLLVAVVSFALGFLAGVLLTVALT